jgi:hypothetical protein
MPRKRKSDLASLAQQRLANTRSAIANPHLIPPKVKVKAVELMGQEHSTIAEAIDKARERCAIFKAEDVKRHAPTFGVGNSSYAIQPR